MSTPSIWIEVTAAPGMRDRRVRRKVLPRVYPNPGSRGSTTIFDLVSEIASFDLGR